MVVVQHQVTDVGTRFLSARDLDVGEHLVHFLFAQSIQVLGMLFLGFDFVGENEEVTGQGFSDVYEIFLQIGVDADHLQMVRQPSFDFLLTEEEVLPSIGHHTHGGLLNESLDDLLEDVQIVELGAREVLVQITALSAINQLFIEAVHEVVVENEIFESLQIVDLHLLLLARVLEGMSFVDLRDGEFEVLTQTKD